MTKNKTKSLEEKIEKCHQCPLWKKRTNSVPGEGNPKTRIIFIGEAPGKIEDLTGHPFVGQAGKLLNKLLKLADLKRNKTWIGSVIKCRPPKNRPPKPQELKACKKWINKQIKTIKPKIIVSLGSFALHHFLPKSVKITQIHGQPKKIIFAGRKIILLPMFHPAAGLRSARTKKNLEEDFHKIKTLNL